jgi:hypothetical protein
VPEIYDPNKFKDGREKGRRGKGCNVIDFPFSELCATELYFYAGLKCPKKCICAFAISPGCAMTDLRRKRSKKKIYKKKKVIQDSVGLTLYNKFL